MQSALSGAWQRWKDGIDVFHLIRDQGVILCLTLSSAGLSALLGFAVLGYWHPNNPSFVEVMPISASLVYNLALSFLLGSGAGFMAIATALAQTARHRTTLLNESEQTLAREVARHRQVEDSLQQQTSLLHTVLTCMSEDVIVANEQGTIVLVNQAAQHTLGISPATASADTPLYDWSRLAHIYLPDQQTPFPVERLPLVRALRGEVITDCEQFVLRPGASEGEWRSVNGHPLRDAAGKVRGGVAVGRNITERKQMDEALQKQTEILQSVLESMADGVIVADEQQKLQIFNPAAEGILGKGLTNTRPDEWTQQYGLYLPDMTTPCPTEELPIMQALHGKAIDKVEIFIRHADAPEGIWAQVSGRPLKDRTGMVRGGVVVCRDITEHKRTEEVLRESEERFRSLCTASPVGIFQTDATGICVYTNSRWQEIAGQTQEESLNYGWAQALHPEDRKVLLSEWHLKAAEGQGLTQEFRCIRPSGEARWVHVQAVPCRSDTGIISGYVGIVMDITERKEVERIKDEFVSVVSHELRTPLTSIRGSLGLLASGRLGTLQEKGQRMLDIAVANTDRLVRLINDILDIERIQSGKIAMQKQACNAAELMTQATDGMRALAEKADVTLSVNSHSTRLWADPDRILQTLTNLLGNAIKFSPRGATVWLTAKQQDGDLLFHIKDQGRGIPADKLESIFERFQQVDASDSREKGGTGLGLAICRSIVQQHGGRIWVESVLGEGSTFSFTLPMLNGMEPTACDSSLLASTHTTNGRARTACVLVAEDNADLARVLIMLLQRHGIEGVYARTGREAIHLSQRLSPDLVILDLFMPDGDGFTVVNWLRQQNRLRHVPLVVYSAKDLDENERERLKLGPTQFFTKGRIAPEEFEQRVIGWFNNLIARKREESQRNDDQAYFGH